VRNSVTAIRDAQGAFESILAVSTDITDRKIMEAELQDSEARFRNMADHAPVMMWVTDPTGCCTYLNRLWYEFTGQTEDEAGGLGWTNATHPDDQKRVEDAFLSANAAHAPFRVEYRLRRADGVYRWAIDAASPRFGPDGEFLGYVGSVIDIDERREIEEALRLRSEEFYALAENIPSLCWIAYADGHIFWYNRRWYEYTGTTPESVEGWGWESVHDPEMLPVVVARWKLSLEIGEPFEMTFPLKGADGAFRPFLTRIVPIRNELNRIVRWFGTNVDISEQRQTEVRLERRVEESTRERDQLWALSEDLLAVANYEGSLLRVSPSWTRLLGYDQTTLLTRPYGEIIHPDDLGMTMDALVTMRSTGQSASFENRVLAAGGDWRWIAWTVSSEPGASA
jgi:PAS domain S-box-containing protein